MAGLRRTKAKVCQTEHAEGVRSICSAGMRVIGRLLEAALVLTFFLGLWASRRRHAKRGRGAHAGRPLLWVHDRGNDTYASSYVGGTGWDGHVAPGPSPEAPQDGTPKRLHRHRRLRRGSVLRRQARRRLSRLGIRRGN